MNPGKTIFSQLMDFLPQYEFRKCVTRYRGHYKVKRFTCWDQFLCMAFAQLTYRESLRDIEACLRGGQNRLYHMGLRSQISRNTLANANKVRDWRIFADFAQVIIRQARKLYAQEKFALELEQTAYALDSSIISLYLSVFPWADFQHTRSAVKLHTLLDLRGNIPALIMITKGVVHDVHFLDQIPLEPGAFYIMDRGYLDYKRLYRIHLCSAFFVIRAKNQLKFKRLYSHHLDRTTGLICDQTIVLTGHFPSRKYPEKLRRIRYRDPEQNRTLVFLTNNFSLSALTITELYRCRWQVELFFRWIKQHLRIKAFYGLTENAVKTQIWTAITVYVLVAVVKKQLQLKPSLYTILQILSVMLFEKIPIFQALNMINYQNQSDQNDNQLLLFN